MSGRDPLQAMGDRMGDGTPALGDAPSGTGQVHSGLHSGPSEEMSGIGFAPPSADESRSGNALRDRVRHAGNVVAEQASDLRDRASDTVGGVRDRVGGMAGSAGSRASDLAGTARERVGGAVNRASGFLEERGIIQTLRENPLPALGIAFGIGFLLAGRNNTLVKPGTRAQHTRDQIRAAILAGVGTAVANEARALLGGAGETGPVATLLNNLERRITGDESGSFSGGGSRGGDRSGSRGSRRGPSHRGA